MKNSLKKISLLFLLIVSFIACDKDYNNIGTNLIIHSDFISDSLTLPAIAYNKVVAPVRSNNLNSSLFGVYKDPTYGLTTTHIVTQLTPTSFDPDFGEEPEIESVVLTIPYFSSNTGETDDDGNTIYELDSVFGNPDYPVKLSIYENTYYLRNYDPATNLEESQEYYSNSNTTIDFNSFQGELLYLDENFKPSASEIVLGEINDETGEFEETDRLTPALRIELLNPNNFWESLLFENEGSDVLSNSTNFVNFFRGIYIKAEASGDDGFMLMLDFVNNGANITVNYSNLTTTTDENGEEVEERNSFEYVMNLSGNKVNVVENNFDISLSDGDEQNGDEAIYLKGMEGSMGIIKILPDPDMATETNEALDDFRETFAKRLINEANLIVYVDRDMVTEGEPDRLYLYDLKNDTYIIDYFTDPTLNTAIPLFSRVFFSTLLERDENEDENGYKKGIKYKFRVTEHLNNILLRDSTNLDLGLVVTTNINNINMLKLEGSSESSAVRNIPSGTFLSPRGTVVYGSNDNVPEDKRLELEIFYSELPEEN